MTKFEYFKKWLAERDALEAWEVNRANDDAKFYENDESGFIDMAFEWRDTKQPTGYWSSLGHEWGDLCETANWDELLQEEVSCEGTNFIDATQVDYGVVQDDVSNEPISPNYTLENILGFYYSITQKNNVTTSGDKKLLCDIIDVANSWEV